MNEWIQWTGGKCPVPLDTLVEVRTRSLGDHIGPAGLFCWRIKEGFIPSYDILAYRIVDDKD